MATKKKVAEKPTKKAPKKKVAAKPVVSRHKTIKKPEAKKSVPAKKSILKKPTVSKPVAKKPAPKHITKKVQIKNIVQKPVVKRPASKPIAQKITKLIDKPVKSKSKTETKVPVPPVAAKPVKKPSTPATNRKQEVEKEIPLKRVVVQPKKSSLIYQPDFTKSLLDHSQSSGPVYRYSDGELQEFKDLILKKLEPAKKELVYLQGLITRKDEAGTDDTENKYMSMEDGSGTMEREQLNQMASRQIQFIDHLEKALMRIENKTYGICRVTGRLIDKARLRAVPHATLSIEAKQAMNK